MIGRYESPLLQIACILAVLGISCPASASPVLDGASTTSGLPIETTTPSSSGQTSQPPTGYVPHRDIHLAYKLYNEVATFGGGQVQCNEDNGHLVSIHDEKTLGYADELREPKTTSYIHAGIYKAPNGKWTSDATRKTVGVPWKDGVQKGNGDCISIDGNGEPVAAECSAQYSFICQRAM